MNIDREMRRGLTFFVVELVDEELGLELKLLEESKRNVNRRVLILKEKLEIGLSWSE